MRLIRHPASNGGEACSVEARVERVGDALQLTYALTGAVRAAGAAASKRTDGLWRTTCFEAFVAAGPAVYFEINLSPSSQWAAYRFDGYRQGMTPAPIHAPPIEVERGDTLTLTAALALGDLPELVGRPWQVGISAVVEDEAGAVSYWALRHGPGKPDFHHPDSFVLELPPHEDRS